MAVQAGLYLAWSGTPEDMFCRVVAHIYVELIGFDKAIPCFHRVMSVGDKKGKGHIDY